MSAAPAGRRRKAVRLRRRAGEISPEVAMDAGNRRRTVWRHGTGRRAQHMTGVDRTHTSPLSHLRTLIRHEGDPSAAVRE